MLSILLGVLVAIKNYAVLGTVSGDIEDEMLFTLSVCSLMAAVIGGMNKLHRLMDVFPTYMVGKVLIYNHLNVLEDTV